MKIELTEGQCELTSHVLGLEVTTAHDMERHHNAQVWNNPELEEGERN